MRPHVDQMHCKECELRSRHEDAITRTQKLLDACERAVEYTL